MWKQNFELYLLVSGKCNKTHNVKTAMPFNLLDDEAIPIYKTFVYATTGGKNKRNTL